MWNENPSGHKQGFYRGRRNPQVQSREATGWGREKGGWQAVNGTPKKLCARDCVCLSTQLQMSLGFLPLSPLLPSPHPLTHSFSHSYLPPYFVFLSFFLFQLNEKECVTGSGHQTNPTTHALSQKQKQGLIKQRDEAVGIFTLIRKSNSRLTDKVEILKYRVKY